MKIIHKMTRQELIRYIKKHDPLLRDSSFARCTYPKLAELKNFSDRVQGKIGKLNAVHVSDAEIKTETSGSDMYKIESF